MSTNDTHTDNAILSILSQLDDPSEVAQTQTNIEKDLARALRQMGNPAETPAPQKEVTETKALVVPSAPKPAVLQSQLFFPVGTSTTNTLSNRYNPYDLALLYRDQLAQKIGETAPNKDAGALALEAEKIICREYRNAALELRDDARARAKIWGLVAVGALLSGVAISSGFCLVLSVLCTAKFFGNDFNAFCINSLAYDESFQNDQKRKLKTYKETKPSTNARKEISNKLLRAKNHWLSRHRKDVFMIFVEWKQSPEL